MVEYKRLDRRIGRAFIFSRANALREQIEPCCLSKQQRQLTEGFVMPVKNQRKATPTIDDLRNLSAQEIADKYSISLRTAYRYKKPFRKVAQLKFCFCPDCGKRIETRVSQCRSCYVKRGITPSYCIDCGTEVIPRKNSRYCHKCYGEYRSRVFRGENNPLWKQERLQCLFCGADFEGYSYRKYCSSKCAARGRPYPAGKDHPMWRGGISFDPYPPEFNDNLKQEIKERDNYCCKLCGAVNRRLCVHHIDYDKQNSGKDNLVTLCVNCHGMTHTDRQFWTTYFMEVQPSIRQFIQTETDYEKGE